MVLLTAGKLPHPFISTMGTQNIYKGLSLVITGATPIAGLPALIRWPGAAFLSSNRDTFLGKIPVSFVLMVIIKFIIFSVFKLYDLRTTYLCSWWKYRDSKIIWH